MTVPPGPKLTVVGWVEFRRNPSTWHVSKRPPGSKKIMGIGAWRLNPFYENSRRLVGWVEPDETHRSACFLSPERFNIRP
jgi:hypothetical protein